VFPPILVYMKHILFASFTAVLLSTVSLRADTTPLPWNGVCQASRDHRLTITTTTGETVEGYCTAINVDEITLTKNQQVVKIARNTISRLRMHRTKGHQLAALWTHVGHGLREGTGLLFSPYAPVGMVELPGSLAWGAAATPFCLIADVADRLSGENEIQIK
jgi:hypothetical protein